MKTSVQMTRSVLLFWLPTGFKWAQWLLFDTQFWTIAHFYWRREQGAIYLWETFIFLKWIMHMVTNCGYSRQGHNLRKKVGMEEDIALVAWFTTYNLVGMSIMSRTTKKIHEAYRLVWICYSRFLLTVAKGPFRGNCYKWGLFNWSVTDWLLFPPGLWPPAKWWGGSPLLPSRRPPTLPRLPHPSTAVWGSGAPAP